ncbi:MAG TPA: isoleucine--tRNA ligase [Gaiellaceae bacterium]|nr:isoleucine--tRNA ligase [Gaiellaceae bacterium]
MARLFSPLPAVPDHPALEREVLERWERERTFERLRELNAGGPRFSFIDGPITANNPMGVHHAWGRTLKDVFQRYQALRGHELRYQNGFDCQGLWVEVEVEKALGLNSKREIEEYGLADFAARCRERVARFAEVITEQSRRLGMWMDWDRDYYTFSDTNIEYIWRFLKEVHQRGWLFLGHRSTMWCPRCGTSLSQHEQAGEGNYEELDHPSLYVRFPIEDSAEALVVWTTTPWTLPANVAAAVKPDADYGLFGDEWWAVGLRPDETPSRVLRGEELVGRTYSGPFDELDPQQGVVHRVIPWDDVGLDEGTGIVHIAPGAGTEDFELSRVHDLPVIVPINEDGRFYPAFGFLAGLATGEAEEPVVAALRDRGVLVEAGRVTHRYPLCWRCRTPLLFRVVDDWFIGVDGIRDALLAHNQDVEWTPPQYRKRMDDWLRNMGDWNISRKRYFGLPLPFYPCTCGTLNVVGSRAELEERAIRGLDQLQELHRPWIDEVPIRCEACGNEVNRIPEVGDAWLDAGIVPLSTLGWGNDRWVEEGYATGAAEGLTRADLPDQAYWEQWFPADWISEMREQIRLWFYSISFMAMTLVGRLPYRRVLTYEKLLDETGREMHRSWGNAIDANEALEGMGADVMRWLFCEIAPAQNLKFGYGPAAEAKRRLLKLWESAKFFVMYASIDDFRPSYDDLAAPPPAGQPLDAWLVARTHRLVAETTAAYDRYWTPAITRAFEAFLDDLSNWYIRRSRRRFWSDDEAAFRTLWYALVQAVRVIAPVMPFLADELWRNLVAGACEGAPDSVHLAGWPELAAPDEALLAEIAEVRDIVELGWRARGEAAIKLRQPLRRLYVRGAVLAKPYADEIAAELRVKQVAFDEGPVGQVRLLPNLPVLGPRLGAKVRDVRDALERGDFEELPDGCYRAAGVELGPDDVVRGERIDLPGWAIAENGTVSVALDTGLDPELEREGRVNDLIHAVNVLRKERRLELTDRISLTVPEQDADLLEEFGEQIKAETLAVELATAPSLRVEKI